MTIATATASEMMYSAERILSELTPDDDKRKIHVYEAEDGTAFGISLTDLEALALETAWQGEQIANENYNRVND